MQKSEQLRKMIEDKIHRLEGMRKNGSYSKPLEEEIAFLADVYKDITGEITIETILNVKSFSDGIDFMINKNFNMPKATKKYADELVKNLKAVHGV